MLCITFSLLKRRLAKINCALRVFRRLRWVLLSAKISGTDIQEMNKRTIACVGAKKTRSDLSRGAHFKHVQRYWRHLTFWLMHNVTSFYHLRGRMRKRRCHSIRVLPNENVNRHCSSNRVPMKLLRACVRNLYSSPSETCRWAQQKARGTLC